MNGKWNATHVKNATELELLLDNLTAQGIPIFGVCPTAGLRVQTESPLQVVTTGYTVYTLVPTT